MKKRVDMNTLTKYFLCLSFLFLALLLNGCVKENRNDIEGIWINKEKGDIVVITDSILANNYNPFCHYHLFNNNGNIYIGDTCLSMRGEGFLAGYRIKKVDVNTLLISNKDDSLFLTPLNLEKCHKINKLEISFAYSPIEYHHSFIEIDYNRRIFLVDKKEKPWSEALELLENFCFRDELLLNQQSHSQPAPPGTPVFDMKIHLENNEFHEIIVRGINTTSVNVQVLILYLMTFPCIE
jgi:hypothetical protein